MTVTSSTSFVASSGRSLAIDFLRGLALWCIFVDHVPGNWLAHLTFSKFACCDAAEAFVLLAGISAGFSYKKYLFVKSLSPSLGQKVFRRVAKLYSAHILLSALFIAEIFGLGHFRNGEIATQRMGLDHVSVDTLRTLFNLMTLDYQPPLMVVLPMYIAVMLVFISFIYSHLSQSQMFLASGIIYVLVQILDLHLPGWPSTEFSFNPLAWQFLFLVGVLSCNQSFAEIKPPILLSYAAVLLILFGFAIHLMSYLSKQGYPGAWAQIIMSEKQKSNLNPFRLLNVLAWAWAAFRSRCWYSTYLSDRIFRPIILLGRHSLPVYCIGTLLSPLGEVILISNPSIFGEATCNILGASGMLGVALVFKCAGAHNVRV